MLNSLENLESRRLFSATYAYAHDTQTLGVFGSEGADDIRIVVAQTMVSSSQTQQTTTQTSAPSTISGLSRSTQLSRGISIYAEGSLIFNSVRDGLSGIRSIVVFGNGGDDTITASNSNTAIDITIYGGEGNDHIWGSALADDLFGEAGDDVIHGGAGNDYLVGGSGHDELYGEDGDDTLLNGGEESDLLDGGDGFDRAMPGLNDKMDGLEELIFAV